MTVSSVKFLPSGDTALTVEFGTHISKSLNRRIVALSQFLAAAEIPGLRDLVPTYRSLLVHYDPLSLSQAELIAQLTPLINSLSVSATEDLHREATHWQIPICFDPEFAPDLEHISTTTGMSPEQVIKTMLDVTHHVYMIGFAPGQPYMGDLPPILNIPRRKSPIARIEKGSLITATGLTIIYPVANPTGWHVIGRTPVEIFSLERTNPALFRPGDAVSLRRIDRSEFDALNGQNLDPQKLRLL